MAAAVLSVHPHAEIERQGDETLLVTLDAEDLAPGFINCARVHGLYCQSPGDLDDLVMGLAASLTAPDAPMTSDALRIVIRPHTFLLPGGRADDAQLSRPIAGALHALVAHDSPRAVTFPIASKLREDLGLADAEIWARASDNTRRNLPQIGLPPPGEVSLIICAEGEATGLLAMEGDWQEIDDEAADGVLVLPAEKNVLCVIAGCDPAAMPALTEVLRIAEGSPDFLSSAPLTRRNGRWIEASTLDPAFNARGPRH